MEKIKNYTGAMNLYQASLIVSIIRDTHNLIFPDEYEKLILMCDTILRFLKDSQLDDSDVYESIAATRKGFNYNTNEEEKKKYFEIIIKQKLNENATKIAKIFDIPFVSIK